MSYQTRSEVRGQNVRPFRGRLRWRRRRDWTWCCRKDGSKGPVRGRWRSSPRPPRQPFGSVRFLPRLPSESHSARTTLVGTVLGVGSSGTLSLALRALSNCKAGGRAEFGRGQRQLEDATDEGKPSQPQQKGPTDRQKRTASGYRMRAGQRHPDCHVVLGSNGSCGRRCLSLNTHLLRRAPITRSIARIAPNATSDKRPSLQNSSLPQAVKAYRTPRRDVRPALARRTILVLDPAPVPPCLCARPQPGGPPARPCPRDDRRITCTAACRGRRRARPRPSRGRLGGRSARQQLAVARTDGYGVRRLQLLLSISVLADVDSSSFDPCRGSPENAWKAHNQRTLKALHACVGTHLSCPCVLPTSLLS